MIMLYKDPHGETIFSSSRAAPSINIKTANGEGGGVVERDGTGTETVISTLRKRVIELEEILAQTKVWDQFMLSVHAFGSRGHVFLILDTRMKMWTQRSEQDSQLLQTLLLLRTTVIYHAPYH